MPSRDLVETLRDKRIFLTGGTGFFGKSILDYLLRHPVPGLQLRILARNCDTFREQYPELCQVPGLEFFSGDIRNFPFPSGSSDFVIQSVRWSIPRSAEPEDFSSSAPERSTGSSLRRWNALRKSFPANRLRNTGRQSWRRRSFVRNRDRMW